METAGIVPGGLSGLARSARKFERDGRGSVERPLAAAGAGGRTKAQSARDKSRFIHVFACGGPVRPGEAIERGERTNSPAGRQTPGGRDFAGRSRSFVGIQLFGTTQQSSPFS